MESITQKKQLARDITFSALRIVAGIILTAHGWLKLTDLEGWQNQLQSLGVAAPEAISYFAIAGELLGGLGLIVGLLTPIAAIGTASTSCAAIVLVHWEHGLMAMNNGFEYPLTLLVVSLFFIANGGGPYSLDALIARQRHAKEEKRASDRPGNWQSSPHGGG